MNYSVGYTCENTPLFNVKLIEPLKRCKNSAKIASGTFCVAHSPVLRPLLQSNFLGWATLILCCFLMHPAVMTVSSPLLARGITFITPTLPLFERASSASVAPAVPLRRAFCPLVAPAMIPRSDPRFVMRVPAPPAVTPWVPDFATYADMHAASLDDPDSFWNSIADQFEWSPPPDDATHAHSSPNGRAPSATLAYNFDPTVEPVHVSFMRGRRTNICYNAVDRWARDPNRRDAVAFHCEGNEPGARTTVTFAQLADTVNRFANVLRNDLGVRKGDVVILYMPMIPELPAAMLACARIGAIHSVVFGGFSAESLAGRIVDSAAAVSVVAHSVGRGKKTIQLKQIADEAIDIAAAAGHVVRHQVVTGADAHSDDMNPQRDVSWESSLAAARPECDVEWVDAEHPLFILYTSGSTGKPKGIVHSTGGYMVFTATTFKYVFDYHEGDVFFSTSDCGWITGHSYVTYGPLLNGATQVLFEGVPNYPNAGRLWDIVAAYGVTQLYTAPTVIRALKGAAPPPATEEQPSPTADDWVLRTDVSSLRVLGTVGEPINPGAWRWYYDVVGRGLCIIVDTWWQTETGGHCLTPLPIPGLPLKPGCAMLPFFGVEPALVDADGRELQGAAEGFLVLKRAWPSTLRTVHGDHARMEQTYFSRFPGYYMTGDGARRDADGHYWLTGRVDDILNVSGHRIGTAEVESALVMHASVVEAAVVGIPHPVKGEALYAYVTLMSGTEPSEDLRTSIRLVVRKEIGPFATPDTIHWAPALPKTRSGKIMRRILRRIAVSGHDTSEDELGDTSTLTDPGVVDALLRTYGQ